MAERRRRGYSRTLFATQPVCTEHARQERMPFDGALFNTWRPRALAVLRIVTAYLFLQHGTAKLLGIPAVEMFKEGVPLLSMGGIAGLLEIVGGLLLLIGLFTRPTAFILCGEMAFAYFIGHASRGHILVPMLNDGELAVLFCFVFLYLAAAGAGAWSVDAIRRNSASSTTRDDTVSASR